MVNWKGFGRNRSWPNVKVASQHSIGGTEENHDNVSQDSLSLGRNLNPRPPEYEAGVLTARPRRAVNCSK
jgi:hypothetical protein